MRMFSILALAAFTSIGASAVELQPASVTPVSWRFNLVFNDEVDGQWEYNISADGARTHISGGTTWVSQSISETEDMYVDTATWAPLSLVVDGDFAGTQLGAEITWDGAHATGPITVQPVGADAAVTPIDLEMPAGLYERTAFFGGLRGAELAAGDELTISWFNVHAQGVEEVTVTVGAAVELTVPAGTFMTYPVEIVGANLTNIAYVTTSAPRDIVRVDVIGQPMVFELVSSTTP